MRRGTTRLTSHLRDDLGKQEDACEGKGDGVAVGKEVDGEVGEGNNSLRARQVMKPRRKKKREDRSRLQDNSTSQDYKSKSSSSRVVLDASSHEPARERRHQRRAANELQHHGRLERLQRHHSKRLLPDPHARRLARQCHVPGGACDALAGGGEVELVGRKGSRKRTLRVRAGRTRGLRALADVHGRREREDGEVGEGSYSRHERDRRRSINEGGGGGGGGGERGLSLYRAVLWRQRVALGLSGACPVAVGGDAVVEVVEDLEGGLEGEEVGVSGEGGAVEDEEATGGPVHHREGGGEG
eukprot:397737-Hanusia_phi.AAC.1